MIDGTGSPAQLNRTVVIQGDRIRSIATKQTDTPSVAKTVDMHGQTIMPLIINAHGHLGMVKGTSSGVANEPQDNFAISFSGTKLWNWRCAVDGH